MLHRTTKEHFVWEITRDAEGRLFEDQVVFGVQVELGVSVDGDFGGGAGGGRHADHDVDTRWQDDRPEGQRVGRDGRYAEHLGVIVHYRAPAGQVICGAASRCGNQQSISAYL